ncbi:hypothetical protein ACIRS1_07585 [Kitasatospora sp. NPDC101176]
MLGRIDDHQRRFREPAAGQGDGEGGSGAGHDAGAAGDRGHATEPRS